MNFRPSWLCSSAAQYHSAPPNTVARGNVDRLLCAPGLNRRRVRANQLKAGSAGCYKVSLLVTEKSSEG